jgi:GNAT superfamily N-acetyltransferase
MRTARAAGIIYTSGEPPDAREAVEVFARSGLKEPITDPERMRRLLETADVLVCARVEGRLVGLARGLCDFLYACYLSDLVVDRDLQGRGVGRELMRRVRDAAGEGVRVHLFAAPEAASYYEHIGCERIADGWRLPPEW